MVYGYVRISTKKQNIERQVRNILREYPKAKIYEEIYTGTKLDNRKEFQKLLKVVKGGDVIVFDSVSRMSRNAADGYNLYMELFEKGVNLVFLKERYIDTDVFNKALNIDIPLTSNEIANISINATKEILKVIAKEQIKVAFEQSEKEVKDLQKRTEEGLETARNNGKTLGYPKGRKNKELPKIKKAKEIILKHSKECNGKLNASEVSKLASISRTTYYKLVAEMKEEQLSKLKEQGIMKGQMDIDDVEANLEPMVKVTNSTAPISADNESNITSEPTVVDDLPCYSSSKDEPKETKEQPKSTKDVDRLESLKDYCLRKYSPKDVITITNVRNWLSSKEAKIIKKNYTSKDDELANLLLELEVKVKAKNKLIKHFYTDTNGNLAYWFI